MHRPSHSLALVRSPKLKAVGPRWYRYYAGFDPGFVADVCDALAVEEGSSALDPWMGSGTTLGVAATRGADVAGIDLNPAMVVVAKGRLLASDTIGSLDPLGWDLARSFEEVDFPRTDPLRHWFDEPSARHIRGLSSRIVQVLGYDQSEVIDANSLSSLACFYYVALFEAVTHSVRSYASRNPTWIKRAASYDGVVQLSRAQLSEAFTTAVKRLSVFLRGTRFVTTEVHDAAHIATGDSRSMPFSDSSFDAVITSPPYLTRLDYVMGHAPELATLGYDNEELRMLRDSMIGTPTRKVDVGVLPQLGGAADSLLESVAQHPSYAARSYYEPNFRQYFVGMAKSFDEITRVAKPGAKILMVVQDSRFKDLHIDLAAALTDMGVGRGWLEGARKDFTSLRTMAQLNTNAHELARTVKPVESAISFTIPANKGLIT